MPLKNVNLASIASEFVSNGEVRKTILADPTAALKEAGIDIGAATVKATYTEADGKGTLDITVYNAGANWTGVGTLTLVK